MNGQPHHFGLAGGSPSRFLISRCILGLMTTTWGAVAQTEPAETAPTAGDSESRTPQGNPTSSDAGPEPDQKRAAPDGPDQRACLTAHSKAQTLKKETRFLEAQEQLFICSSATCPGPVIADCGRWLEELDRRTPSLAFSVRLDNVESQEARVVLDGKVVADRSGITKVDPGRHVVRVELPPFEPREEVVFARDGAGTQVVRFAFETEKPGLEPSPAPLAAQPSEPPQRPVPTVVYPLLGLSVAGVASFGVFAWIGNERQRELEEECEPSCTDDEVQPMKNSYMIGDVSLAIGVASLVSAGIIYLARPTKPATQTEPGWSLQVQPVVGKKQSSLGVVAVQSW